MNKFIVVEREGESLVLSKFKISFSSFLSLHPHQRKSDIISNSY